MGCGVLGCGGGKRSGEGGVPATGGGGGGGGWVGGSSDGQGGDGVTYQAKLFFKLFVVLIKK